jgi:hypothetical protein
VNRAEQGMDREEAHAGARANGGARQWGGVAVGALGERRSPTKTRYLKGKARWRRTQGSLS